MGWIGSSNRNAIFYDSVADMKASVNEIGATVITNGYYKPNDGGGGTYIIRKKVDGDIDDGGSIHVLDNGYVAELVVGSEVSVKQFGAKGDCTNDDTMCIQCAVDFSDTVFFPSGKYIITKPIYLTSNKTLYGVGRESKIKNTVAVGFEKYCIITGEMSVGDAVDSFLKIQSYNCTVNDDCFGVTLDDVSDFAVDDIVFVCLDETYTTKNPPYYWNAKVISKNGNSLVFDAYIDNRFIVGKKCVIRNMKHISELVNNTNKRCFISENICIHDLNLENIIDDGSGMYVLGIGTYNGNFYNLWIHGNTCIGSNYAINCTFDNIVSEFDGGFCDIPEINQNVVIRNCIGKRFENRVNQIGLTLLQGYGCLIENNRFDFGNNGRVSVGNHILPVIRNNMFLNVNFKGGSIYLSSFGSNVFVGNSISQKTSETFVVIPGKDNIFKDNIIDNPNCPRWYYAFSTSVDLSENCIENNITTGKQYSDVYYSVLPETDIRTRAPQYEITTKTINSNDSYKIYDSSLGAYYNFGDAKVVYFRIVFNAIASFKLNYKFKETDRIISKIFENVTTLEMYFSNGWSNIIISDGKGTVVPDNCKGYLEYISIENTMDSSIAIGFVEKKILRK